MFSLKSLILGSFESGTFLDFALLPFTTLAVGQKNLLLYDQCNAKDCVFDLEIMRWPRGYCGETSADDDGDDNGDDDDDIY